MKRAMACMVAMLAFVWVLLLPLIFSGCGPSLGQTQAAYQGEVDRCLGNERAIVARPDTTADQDAADLASERARCDAALAAIREACGRKCR